MTISEDDKSGVLHYTNAQVIDRYFGNANWLFSFKGNDATLTMIKTAEDFMDEYEGIIPAIKM